MIQVNLFDNNCALVSEIDEFLYGKGFKKIEEIDTGCEWGDALYIKS